MDRYDILVYRSCVDNQTFDEVSPSGPTAWDVDIESDIPLIEYQKAQFKLRSSGHYTGPEIFIL